MDASATGRLEWCTTVCSLVLIAISLFLFIIFVNVVISKRWDVVCGLYGCSNAYNKTKLDVGFFRFLKQQMQ